MRGDLAVHHVGEDLIAFADNGGSGFVAGGFYAKDEHENGR